MGTGITFFKGMDDSNTPAGDTQPGEPRMASGGPIEGYKGCDEGHSFGTGTGNQSVPGGEIFESPMDK